MRCRDGSEFHYDFLIVAAGARHSYFGHTEWESCAPGLKSIEDAIELRRRWLLAFERAERTTDDAERAANLTFVIVGGGPTGVELAGMLPTIARFALPKDFRHIDTAAARIILLEAGPRLLPTFPDELSARAASAISTELGVDVRTNTRRHERRRRIRRDGRRAHRRRARSSGRPATRRRRLGASLGATARPDGARRS